MQEGIIGTVEEITKEGKKTFYRVKLQDGADMSTFDPRIKLAESGDGLEFDVIVNGKYINLKDGFTITKNASPVSEHKKENGYPIMQHYPDMSKGDWEEKDRRKDASIESQVAVKCVLNYAIGLLASGTAINDNPPHIRLIGKALEWCESKIDAVMTDTVKSPAPAVNKAKSTEKPKDNPSTKGASQTTNDNGEIEFDGSPIKNLGELWSRCKNYNISKSEGLELAGVNQSDISDLDATWKIIFDRKFIGAEETRTKEDVTQEE